jgi:hypothetical protein
MHRHSDGQRATHRIATDQRDAKALGQRKQAGRKLFKPQRFGLRQRQGQRTPQRLRRHGRQVTEIDSKTAMTDRAGRNSGWEMRAFGNGVGRDHQIPARLEAQHGSIVADAEHHILAANAATGEVSADRRRSSTGTLPVLSGRRAQFRRKLVENGVDVAMPVLGTELMREFDGLVDHDLHRHLAMQFQFGEPQPEYAPLDRIKLGHRSVGLPRQQTVQRIGITENLAEQEAEVIDVDEPEVALYSELRGDFSR